MNKLALQKDLGWVSEKKIPMACIPGGMSDALGGKAFTEVIDGILDLNCQIVVLGKGSEEFGKLFTKLEQEHEHRVKILKDDDETRRRMYAAADISLFFATDEAELLNCLSYGAVPVSPAQELLEDYNPVQESGNAFIADPMTPWSWFAGLVRAIETLKLPYDYRTIQKHAMETVKGE